MRATGYEEHGLTERRAAGGTVLHRPPKTVVPVVRPNRKPRSGRSMARPNGSRAGQAHSVALVFQGGGSLAAPQVGMLRALREAGLIPDLVLGSSAGALNAVAFASDPSLAGIGRLEATWKSVRRRHVAPLSTRTLLAAATGGGDGLVPSNALRGLLAAAEVPRTLEGCFIPAHVVATELASGAAVVLSAGETVSALLASCAFPGLYPPVELGGRVLVDGGVAADVPVMQAEALGAAVTYVLPAATLETVTSPPRGPLPVAFLALGHIRDSLARSQVAAAQGTVHLLPAPAGRGGNPVDFRDTSRLISDGYRLATAWLASHSLQAASGS